MNYHYPSEEVLNHGLTIDKEVLKELQKDIEEWGMTFHLLTPYEVC